MKTIRLTRSDKNRLQRPNREVSSFIEQLVVTEYSDFESGFTDSSAYDIQGSGDTVAEVKHTLRRHTSGQKGRFRIFKQQHNGLVRRDRRGTAYYVFVLISPQDDLLQMVRKKPSSVGRLIAGRGGFYNASHNAGQDHKLPWGEFFS